MIKLTGTNISENVVGCMTCNSRKKSRYKSKLVMYKYKYNIQHKKPGTVTSNISVLVDVLGDFWIKHGVKHFKSIIIN